MIYKSIDINTIAVTTCNNPIHKAYNDIALPCFINDFKLTLRPMAAKAIISSLLLINLNIFDNSGDIILNVNSAHVMKNPITYQGIFILPFLCSRRMVDNLIIHYREVRKNITVFVPCLRSK